MRNILKAATLAVLLAAVPLFAADWPGYRGPNTDGIVPATIGDKFDLTQVWKIPFGNSFGQIAVAGDKAVAFIKRGEDEVAVCLDAKTGKELWAVVIDNSIHDRQGGDGPRSTPAISADRVYIYGTHMKLVCLDLAAGKEIWQHSIKTEFAGKELQWGSAASPLVIDDRVIVVGGGPGEEAKGILAFDKTTGKLDWAIPKERTTHATPAVATILGTKQVVCFMQSGLVSVDPATGKILWTYAFPIKAAVGTSPVVGGKNGDVVFCSAGYGVGAAACRISQKDGQWSATQLWKTPKQNMMHWSTPVYRDGFIYGLVGPNNSTPPSDRGNLACIDIETGNVKWSQANIGTQGGMILLGDKLVIQTPTGDLLLAAASPEGFKQLDRAHVFKGKNWTAPAFAGGMLFVRDTTDGQSPAEAACLKIAAN